MIRQTVLSGLCGRKIFLQIDTKSNKHKRSINSTLKLNSCFLRYHRKVKKVTERQEEKML